MQEKQIDLIVHVTHEAGFKVGGIGAVLDGMLGSTAYNTSVKRTILVGPMDTGNSMDMARLESRGRLEIVYSSWHGIENAPKEISKGLYEVEERFRVKVLYGYRTFQGPDGDYRHEVLLVDAHWADLNETNNCKLLFWQHYGIESDRYEWNQEYDLVIRAAHPSLGALQVLVREEERSRFMIAHEWMGLPLAFCCRMNEPDPWRIIFYAHEMATARILVEDHPGHDTRFYNVLWQAQTAGMTMEELFGDRSGYFKHALIKRATALDGILAVGRWVREEMRFLGGSFSSANIDLVFNGLVMDEIEFEERNESIDRLRQYSYNLLGYWPDYILTHVTRMVISKGLWRDIRVLEHLDKLLCRDNKRAVLFILSTSEQSGKKPEDIYQWESEYGWPVVHHKDNGDLVSHEAPFYRAVETFNAGAKAVKIVFVNQFGWSRETCGQKMPVDMKFIDIRRGTHLEFGQSIYEPFGIAQIEPLGAGALVVVSNVCGCVDFLERAAEQAGWPHVSNLVQADYVTLPANRQVYSPWDALWIDRDIRDWLETSNSYNVAKAIFATLPGTNSQARTLLARGQKVSRYMSWETVVGDYLLPVLNRIQEQAG